MSKNQRNNLSRPFLALGLVLAGSAAAGTIWFATPSLQRVETLILGWLLVAFTFTYSYRPLRESVYGRLVSSLFIMLFAAFFYLHGNRGSLVPFGLFALALTAFCYQLYRLWDGENRHNRAS